MPRPKPTKKNVKYKFQRPSASNQEPETKIIIKQEIEIGGKVTYWQGMSHIYRLQVNIDVKYFTNIQWEK